MEQLSFLKDPAPAGLYLYPEFITPAEEEYLLSEIQQIAWEEVRMHGVVAKRRVKHYGLQYGFESWQLKPTDPPPAFLNPLLKKAAPLLQVSANQIAEVLVSEYAVGAGIGWHRDAPMFGAAVFGISLGSPCVMKFRRKNGASFEIYKAELAPRAAYIISGAARSEWQHHIAPVKTARWSLTFRTLRT